MGFKRIRRKLFAIQVVERFNNKYETPRCIPDYDGPTFQKTSPCTAKVPARTPLLAFKAIECTWQLSVSVWKPQH